MAIPLGLGLIAGRSRENAIGALNAADSLGLSADVVLTVDEGYAVPLEVLDAYESELQRQTETEALDAAQRADDKAVPQTAAQKKAAAKAAADSTSDESPSV